MKPNYWLWVERRAAELGTDAPRGLSGDLYTLDERIGFSIHYWDGHWGTKQERARVPENREQWAGWLARVIYTTPEN